MEDIITVGVNESMPISYEVEVSRVLRKHEDNPELGKDGFS